MGIRIAALMAAVCAGVLPVRAAELVSLTNGFSVSCDHHSIVEGRFRLYTSKSSESYIEFQPKEITGIANVPDPPLAQSEAPREARQSIPVKPQEDARLSPADLHQMLTKAGTVHRIDVDLLASVVKAESGGNAHAVSRTGAKGLMQLMPATAAELGVVDSFHPEQNVRGGSAYLDELLQRYHDNLSLALAAYNAGPAAVDKYHGIPPYRETRLYVARVIHEFNRRVKERMRASAQRTIASGQ